MSFIPRSKRRKGQMDIFELFYGEHVKKESKNKTKKKKKNDNSLKKNIRF
jgi:hypothetical protein